MLLNTISPHETPTFHVNIRQELMLYFFVANMVNIIHGMQVLNMFNYCMDTTGLFIIPFITYSYKIVKASIGSRIFTQGSTHTHPCRPSSCLNCHKPNNWNYCQKILVVIVKKMCHVTGTSVFPSAPPTFPSVDCMYTNWVCSSHQPTKLGILHCFIK